MKKEAYQEQVTKKPRLTTKKAKADYTTSVNELKDTKLYAPFDGYIQKVNIERYQDIKASVR